MAEGGITNKFHNASATLNRDEIKTKITTLFFDLDNTLIPTRVGDSKACRKLSDVLENQFALSKEESASSTQSFLKSFRRCPDNSQTSLDSWRTYLWREALPQRCQHLAEQIYAKWLQLRYRYLALAPESVQMLRRFRERGYLLALITNGPSNAQWEKIKKVNVSQYFDCILVSSDLPWEKPNPNIFFAACNFLNVKPAECIMIGDKLESDIKGGRLAKLGATYWIPHGNAEIDLSDVEYPPDVILKSVLDICKYFPQTNLANSSSSMSAGVSNNASTANMPTSNANMLLQQQQRRKSSQNSFCTAPATSTCERNLFHQFQQQQQQQQQTQQQQQQQQNQSQQHNKYRRAGSLPAIDYMLNSDAENSSDSLFN